MEAAVLRERASDLVVHRAAAAEGVAAAQRGDSDLAGQRGRDFPSASKRSRVAADGEKGKSVRGSATHGRSTAPPVNTPFHLSRIAWRKSSSG